MSMLNYRTYEEAREKFTIDQVWELFDGDRDNLNLGHECVDRHTEKGTAIRVKFEDGHTERYTFHQLSRLSSKFANALESIP